jgi:response regulator NasT
MPFAYRNDEPLEVLLVEHRELVADRLKAQLERLGHHVLGLARDGWEAVAAAEKLHPNLILMETRLPGLDGVDTARAIVSGQPVPVILLTGYAGAELVRRGREAGVVAYLTSLDQRRLLEALAIAQERLAEFRILRREGRDLSEALATQRLVSDAKKVLIGRLGLSEAEAFRHILERRLSTRRSLPETAWTIIEAEGVLARRNFASGLRLISQAISGDRRRRRSGENDKSPAPSR